MPGSFFPFSSNVNTKLGPWNTSPLPAHKVFHQQSQKRVPVRGNGLFPGDRRLWLSESGSLELS